MARGFLLPSSASKASWRTGDKLAGQGDSNVPKFVLRYMAVTSFVLGITSQHITHYMKAFCCILGCIIQPQQYLSQDEMAPTTLRTLLLECMSQP